MLLSKEIWSETQGLEKGNREGKATQGQKMNEHMHACMMSCFSGVRSSWGGGCVLWVLFVWRILCGRARRRFHGILSFFVDLLVPLVPLGRLGSLLPLGSLEAAWQLGSFAAAASLLAAAASLPLGRLKSAEIVKIRCCRWGRPAALNPLMLCLRPVPCATHVRGTAPIERLRASRTAPEWCMSYCVCDTPPRANL